MSLQYVGKAETGTSMYAKYNTSMHVFNMFQVLLVDQKFVTEFKDTVTTGIVHMRITDREG